MASPMWRNTYSLSHEQISQLEEAENKMESMEINKAEEILLSMIPNASSESEVLKEKVSELSKVLSDLRQRVVMTVRRR